MSANITTETKARRRPFHPISDGAVQSVIDVIKPIGLKVDRPAHDTIVVGNVTTTLFYSENWEREICAKIVVNDDSEEATRVVYDNFDAYQGVSIEILKLLLGEPVWFTPHTPEPLFEKLEGKVITEVTELPCPLGMEFTEYPSEGVVLHLDDRSRVVVQGVDPECYCCVTYMSPYKNMIGTKLNNLAIVDKGYGSYDIVANGGEDIGFIYCDRRPYNEKFFLFVVPPQED